MNIPPEFYIPASLALAGAGGVWVRAVENRLTSNEVVIKKIDELVTLMLEDRLAERADDRVEARRGKAR